MRRSDFLLGLTMLFALGLLYSCSQNPTTEQKKNNPEFVNYISGYTSGIVSSGTSVQIQLKKKIVLPGIQVGDQIDIDLFEFSPKINGKVYLEDDYTINFEPDEPLSSETTFQVKFYLDRIFEVGKDLSVFEFQFETIKQSFHVVKTGFYPYENSNLDYYYIEGYVEMADYLPENEILGLIEASQGSSELSIRWDYQGNPKKFPFFVDSIQRTETVIPVVIQWDGAVMDVDIAGDDTTRIPALSEFSVVDVRLIQQPEQHLQIQFSDPLLEDQNLDGLIRFDSDIDLKFEIKSNTIRAYPAHRLAGTENIHIEKGIKNLKSYRLKNEFSQQLLFEEIKPAVRILSTGVIVPGSEGLIFPFEAVNLNAVDIKIIKIYEDNVLQFLQLNHLSGSNEIRRVGRPVLKKKISLMSKSSLDKGTWNAYSIDLTELVGKEAGVIYKVELSFRLEYSLYNCGSEEETGNLSTADTENELEFDDWDSGYYYYTYYPRAYDWNERDNPCHISYYNGTHWATRNVISSNLGIVAKGGDGLGMRIAVTDLRTTEPLPGVIIDLYNYQQQRIAQTSTDAEGFASVDMETKPWLLVARLGEDYGYLRLDDGSALSMSMFDVSGQVVQKGVKGYIYGERGVWRPGDTLFLNFILEDRKNQLPEDHPVTFELKNPHGKLFYRAVKTNSVKGFYSFTCTTDADAPTGLWSASVGVGALRFYKTIRIETVKPNRLKLKLEYDQKILSYDTKDKNGLLGVKWLHGAVARNLKAKVLVTLNSRRTSFKAYDNYTFDDATKTYYPEELALFDSKVDDQGLAKVTSDLGVHRQAPGMLSANFMVRAFEEGGDFSTDFFTIDYAPFAAFVGVKLPQTEYGRNELITDSTYSIDVVTVDKDGSPVSLDDLEVSVIKMSWRWWWDISNENLGRYVRQNYEDVILEKEISTLRGKGSFRLKIDYPGWGRYLVRVVDQKGGHSTSQVFYADWPSWINRDNREQPEGAKIMNISSDKERYNVGDVATFTFPSGSQGRALVSIEKGAEIIDAFWVTSNGEKEQTLFTLPVTPEMTPNVYINISHIQPHAQTANDLPIRLYGIKPIHVEDPKTRLEPVIQMQDELVPEKQFTVRVSEKNNRPMTYTLAVVDDGLLDLTRFKTPDPWSVFYAKEALGVKTWDLYDDVLGAYGGKIEQLFAIGGDGAELKKSEAKANRFKPVVMFLGPFELKSGHQEHTLNMPRYVGSVRTFVIAGQDGAYGFTDKTTPVRSPLMILGTLPRVLGPGESVKLPVTVFAMDEKVKDVKVEIKTNALLVSDGNQIQYLKFDQNGDKVISFNLKVPEEIGIGKVTIEASSGKEKASYDIEVQVRNPNPSVSKFAESLLQVGDAWDYSYVPVGMSGTNSGLLEVSRIPPVDFGKRLKYLIRYPYGCAEQTTSSAFPQLFMEDVMQLDQRTKSQVSKNVKAAIRRLYSMQHSSGGFLYWPSAHQANDWISSYAGHFLLEAEAKGYTLPQGFRNKWIKYQKAAAGRWVYYDQGHPSYYSYYHLQQAYRLYTLALAGEPDLSSMNRFREMENLSVQSGWRLAAAYVLAGKPEVAMAITKKLNFDVEVPKTMNATFGSSIRDKAMIIETLVAMNEQVEASALVLEVSKQLSSSQWLSTQSTAYGLLALAKFAGNSNLVGENMEFDLQLNGQELEQKSTQKPVSQHKIQIDGVSPGSVEVINRSNSILYARMMLEGVPLVGEETSENSRLEISVNYKNLTGEVLDPSKIEQGTDFIAEVVVTNPHGYGYYKNMALAQVFPSGWEIINTRLAGYSLAQDKNRPDYRDIRDDRVYTHFGFKKKATYVVMLNAAYQGRFYLPAVSCEAMYDNAVYARVAGQWVEVVEPGTK